MEVYVDNTALKKTIQLNITEEAIPNTDISVTAEKTDEHTVKATITNNKEITVTAVFIVAVYDSSKMLKCKMNYIELVPTEAKEESVDFAPDISLDDDKIIKVFVFKDMTSIQPLSLPFVIKK